MKTLKKLLTAGAFLLTTNFFAPEKVYSQTPKIQKQENQDAILNFYLETGDETAYAEMPAFKKNIKAWLCACPKNENQGNIWLYYGDTDNDGVYDYVSVQKNIYPIKSQEKFSFNFDTKKIDYVLKIYDYCQESINKCDEIISKSYNEMDQKEAEYLGSGFFERIKEFVKTQKEFNRFNSKQLEELIRKEYAYQLKIVDGNLVGNSRIPIEKFLSEEEIKKVENYIQEKPERERLKKEQEEKLKELKRQQEKIRTEQEEANRIEKKPKARLKIGGGIAITPRSSHIEPYFGINPQLTNKKGKGFAIGLDIFVMNSKRSFELYGGREDDEESLGPYTDLISHTNYTNSILAKNTNRFGLNIGYVSPVFEIFANAGFLRQKMLITTTAVTEEYTEVYGIQQGQSSFKTRKINWEEEKFLGPYYFGLGMEIFPFLKENNYSKNISFSIEGLIALRRDMGGGDVSEAGYFYSDVYSPTHIMIKAGLKYTFRK